MVVKLETENPLSDKRAGLESGAPGRIRTSDPLIRSQVLYPAELRAHNYQQHYTYSGVIHSNFIDRSFNMC